MIYLFSILRKYVSGNFSRLPGNPLGRMRVFNFISLLLVLLLSHQTDILGQITNFTKNDGLTSLIVTCTYVDSKGIVWIGTNNGLNAYTGSKWYAITSIEDNKSGKPEPLGRIETIFEDSQQNIWVSVMNKIYLYKSNFWTAYTETEIEDYVAKDFFEDRRGWIWVTLEHFKDFSNVPEIKFSLLGGTLQMYDGLRWFKFYEDVAGTLGIEKNETPEYFTTILQDQAGNIWLSSLQGIYMFDGIDWLKYDEEDLVSEKVLKLLLDQEGTLWAATEYGISYLKDDKWVDLTKKEGLCGVNVYDLKEDPDGRIWAYTKKNIRFAGINLIENGKCIPFDKHKTHLKGTVEQLIWKNKEVIAYTKDGVSVFDSAGNWKHYGINEGLPDIKFYSIIKDRWQNVWLVSDKSLYKFNNGMWEQLKEQEEWNVLEMMVDKKGIVWIGTEKKGLFKYQNGNWTNYSIANGLVDKQVSEIFEDKKGNIWVITKKGISKIASE